MAKGTTNRMGVTTGAKNNVCLAPRKKRTTNYLFVVRQYKNARQTIFLPGV
jgi:hypothetical protein